MTQRWPSLSLISALTFTSIFLSACGENKSLDMSDRQYRKYEMTCERQMAIANSGYYYKQTNAGWILCGNNGDYYVLSAEEIRYGAMFDRCDPNYVETHEAYYVNPQANRRNIPQMELSVKKPVYTPDPDLNSDQEEDNESEEIQK